MISFLKQLKWQLILLNKNNIITISLVVTLMYGVILYFLKDTHNIDKFLVSLVLNDPSVIGYFFIALAIYTEIKQGVFNALFVTPLNTHVYLISKIIALSLIGTICSLGLALPIKGFEFDTLNYSIGSFSICLLSAILGLIVLTFASEFLNFALLSIPVFFLFTGVSLLHYLGAINIGGFKYLFFVQAGLDLIDNAVSGTKINYYYVYLSSIIYMPFLYYTAHRLFNRKYVSQ
jgi:fluoroquinolone transport system permease protein